MRRKFKVGDRVRVVRVVTDEFLHQKGWVGTIVEHDGTSEEQLPWHVSFDHTHNRCYSSRHLDLEGDYPMDDAAQEYEEYFRAQEILKGIS